MSCWFPYVTFGLNGGFSGICPCNRTVRPVRPHYPGRYDTGPYDPRPHDHTNIQPYLPGPKFDISSLQHFFTTDGLVTRQAISTCQSFHYHQTRQPQNETETTQQQNTVCGNLQPLSTTNHNHTQTTPPHPTRH